MTLVLYKETCKHKKAFQTPEHVIAKVNMIMRIPLHAFKFRTRMTEGGIVDDPSVSASWKVMINWNLGRHKISNF